MAECKVNKTIKVVLYLSEEEALYLHAMCQNSIGDIVKNTMGDDKNRVLEDSSTYKMRTGIFKALHEAINF